MKYLDDQMNFVAFNIIEAGCKTEIITILLHNYLY